MPGAIFIVYCGRTGLGDDVHVGQHQRRQLERARDRSPSQVPQAADTALITTAGTYIVNLDETANVSSLTVGGATGLQTLQVNANSLTATNATVNGLLTVTNGTLYGAFTLNSGGVLNESGLSLQSTGSLTVENSGVVNMASRFSALGPLTNFGTINLSNGSIAIYNGNGSSYTGGIVNQGTITFPAPTATRSPPMRGRKGVNTSSMRDPST